MSSHHIGYRIGEALVGEGDEIAHIDLIVGDKDGPVGVAFAAALASQNPGHTTLFAVLAPNLLVKPVTLIAPKVTIKNMKQAELAFGAAQYAIAKAVTDSVIENIIPKNVVEDIVIICGLFIHPNAKDPDKVFKYNYDAVKLALKRALACKPSIDEVLTRKDTVIHPFYKLK